jgi:hypothetical protein
MSAQEPLLRQIALRQTTFGLMMLTVMTFPVAAIDLAAHSEQLNKLIEHRRQDACRLEKIPYYAHGFFIDPGDQLLLSELTSTDFSKGGVVLLGASDVALITFFNLGTELKRYVHNFAVGGANPEMQFQFLQFLTKHEGLLAAGGKQTMFIIGTHYHLIHFDYGGDESVKYFPHLFARHGVYLASEDGVDIRVSPITRRLIAERVQIVGFVNTIRSDRDIWNTPSESVIEVRKHLPDDYRSSWVKAMGDQWELKMSSQAAYFGQMLDYVTSHDAKVVVVLMPLGSWDKNLPYAGRWNGEIASLCKNRGIACEDWSQMLDDDEFGDSVHPNVQGAEKLRKAVLELAEPHLRTTGVLHD